MSRKRVSYVIPPPPPETVPRLKLPPLGTPRNGQIGPIVVHSEEHERGAPTNGRANHPRHRLGVAAFAIDKSTQLAGRPSPEGILYTAGRDGMIISWDLGVPMKRKDPRYDAYSPGNRRSKRSGRWERLTRDDEDGDAIYEEDDSEEEDWPTSDGDVIGDVIESGGRRGTKQWGRPTDVAIEDQWETDIDAFDERQPTHIRQSTQAHTDWINDILLCNNNQTVISCSSDGTIKAWNPHSSSASNPVTIGAHSDYVRCLTKSRDRGWVASGSFDRTIKLWDIIQPSGKPIVTLVPPDAPGPKCSVYALATDPMGRLIASGGPERVVRTWDPRTGKRVGKLVGHTDNIRAILMSDDSRYALTGSADASIKLWSLASPQRCIHTFTHHTDSVWSLFSSHPSLETFYSSDRAGYVCRVDVEGADRISDGECLVLCRDKGDKGEQGIAASEGVSKIIVMDDNLMWTASGSSSVRRWKIPQGRLTRTTSGLASPEELSPRSPVAQTFVPRTPTSPTNPHRTRGVSTAPSITASLISNNSSMVDAVDNWDNVLHGIPYDSLVRLSAPNAHHLHGFNPSRSRDADVATLYSAASIMSVPRQVRSPTSGTFQQRPTHTPSNSLIPPAPDYPVPLTARQAFEERDVAPDATPLIAEPDEVIEGEHGLVRVTIMNDRMHALTVDTAGAVAVWDIVRARCLGVFTRDDVRNASSGSSMSDGTAANDHAGRDAEVDKCSPRQALETVRERIEGEAVVLPWASADTKIGELMITLMDRCFESEIFADEAGYGIERSYTDEQRLNIGKWVLRSLFHEFVREEQASQTPPSAYRHPRALTENSPDVRTPGAIAQGSTSKTARGPIPRLQGLSPIAQSPATSIGSDALTPRPLMRSGLSAAPAEKSGLPASLGQAPAVASSLSTASSTLSASTVTSPTLTSSTAAKESQDYFSLRRRPSTAQSATSQAPGQTTPDDFSGWGGPGSAKQTSQEAELATPSTPGGRLMGRLKSLGKSSRRAATEVEAPAQSNAAGDVSEGEDSTSASPPKTLIQRIKSQPFIFPPASEAPPLSIPSDVAIVISEESPSGWTPLYRGLINNSSADASMLEELLPPWLLEFLLTNKAPPVPLTKVSFAMLPAQIPPGLLPLYGETLPELVTSPQTKLSASRFLRVRKLAYHVQEKLEKLANAQSPSPRASSDTQGFSSTRPTTPHSQPNVPSPGGPSSSPSSLSLHSMHMQYQGRRAEEFYEILCNDQVLPLDMTLAAVRQFIWRQSGELVLYYRRKPRSLPTSPFALGS